MATAKQTSKAPADSAALKDAVKEEVQGAEQDAKTGNVATRKQSEGGPQDHPTGTRRSHPVE